MRFAISFALLFAAGIALGAEPKAKPNVVIILVRDLGPRDLGCTGSTYYKTPNIDAFAKQGVKLEEAYFRADISIQALYTLATGRIPERVFDPPDPKGEQYLKGKPQHKLVAPRYEENDQLFKLFAIKELLPPDIAAEKYVGLSDLASQKEGFGEKLKKRSEKAFFAYNFINPNKPTAEAVAKYKPGKPGMQGDPENAARIELIDHQVGVILKALDDAKLTQNTFVVFTSVNCLIGDMGAKEYAYPKTSNAPYRDGQGTLYEGGLRVPFIIRGPQIKNGNFPIAATDILPTLVGLCGIRSAAKYDGVDLSAQFLGTGKPDAGRVFHWHNAYYDMTGNKPGPGGAIRVGSMKLIEYFEDDRRELFDLSKDVGEGRNLAAEKPEVVKDLAAKLAAWRKEVGARKPGLNPDYKPNPQADDGTITMHARTASVTGTQLRFEPAPHKNTLGYWTNAADTASFEFTVTKPGTFTVSVLQGAGKGSGGAEVELAVGDSKATFTVKDTGGFQAFELREVGELKIDKAGIHKLTVTPKTKPGVAVMDLREVVLKPKK